MDFELARTQMVDQQVRAWDVLDGRVLAALREVPREHFVPERYRRLAFADTNIPLPHGQVMMTPQVEGRLLQALELRAGDEVLEIGTGSGFLSACLARLAGNVRSLEIHATLSSEARERLAAVDAPGTTLEVMDACTLDESGRYDAIAITASLPVYVPRFERALKAGGRLFVIVGTPPVMEATLVTRISAEEFARDRLFETSIPALINAPAPDPFVF